MSLARSLVAVLATASLVPAQALIVVDANGTGQFTDLPEAISAASPGDIVIVRPGLYSPFTLDKGLRILGDPGASAGNVFLGYSVRGVPAGQTAVIRGLDAGRNPLPGRINLEDNAGHVHVESLNADGGLSVFECAQVSLLDLNIAGGMPAGLAVSGSTLIASGCTVTGLSGLITVYGMDAVGSDVVFANGTVTGGPPGFRSPASPGLHVAGGQVTVAGDASTIINAGPDIQPVPAIFVESGILTLAPTVQVRPTAGALPIWGVENTLFRSTPALHVTTVPRRLDAELFAPGATQAVLVASVPLSPPVNLPPFGRLWLQFASVVLDAGPVVNERRSATVPLPRLPSGTLAALQYVVLDGAGGIELSTPVASTLDGN